MRKFSPSNKTILALMGDKLVLWLQYLDIGSHSKLVVSVLEGKGASLEGFSNDLNRVMGL